MYSNYSILSVLRMEGRKIQRVGRATLAVSLPRAWVKETGIKQGDLVFCAPQKDGSLNVICLLYTSPSPRDRTRSRMPSSA